MFELWQVTGAQAYASKLRQYVSRWAAAYVPTGNDVNENKLMPLILAYESLRPGFSAGEQGSIDAWLLEIAAKERAAARAEGRAPRSNRDTKRLRLIAAIALSQNRSHWLQETWQDVREYVASGLYPDGTSYDLHHRDSLTYHVSALVPMVDLAVLARHQGESLYAWETPAGSSLRRSVGFVVPFASGLKQREEWTNSRVELDRRRAAAGLADYQPGKPYDPKNAVPLLEAAERFEPEFATLIARLVGSPAKRFPTWWTVINAAVR